MRHNGRLWEAPKWRCSQVAIFLKLGHNVGGLAMSWNEQKNSGCGPPFLRDGQLKNFFRPSISQKRAERFLRNFHGLRVSWGPVYILDRRSMGVQISRGAGGKVAKNGTFDSGWVTFSGSLTFCVVGISIIFAGNVSRDISQHDAYICETSWWRIKKLGTFKKVQKMVIFVWRHLGQGVAAESFSRGGILSIRVRN